MGFWQLLLWAPSPLRSRRVGLLQSFANRWAASPEAIALVPFDRFVTGRIPTTGEYPFPYASTLIGTGRPLSRSDLAVTGMRTISLHVWVDADRLEDGEDVVEVARQLYTNRNWNYNYGRVTDVIDGGPANARQISEGTFQAWELVKLFYLHIEQRRVDEQTTCPRTGSSSDSQSSQESWTDEPSSSFTPPPVEGASSSSLSE